MPFQRRAPSRCGTRVTIFVVFIVHLWASGQALPIKRGAAVERHSNSIRFAVAFSAQQKEEVQRQVLQQGYEMLFEGPGFITVSHQSLVVPPPSSSATKGGRRLIERMQQRNVAKHLDTLSAIAGVSSSEQDVRRHLHLRPSRLQPFHPPISRRLSAVAGTTAAAANTAGDSSQAGASLQSPSSSKHFTGLLVGHWHLNQSRFGQFQPGRYDIWGNYVGDPRCASEDIQLSDSAGAETIPWGINKIGARNATLQKAAQKGGGRVIICVIDSGIWANHPEYRKTSGPGNHDTVNGCNSDNNPDCPYTWSEDIVGHGTHVAGTIGAPENGLGVIGVISQGAEYHIVRIWNDSGDVGQGQGPYATDLLLAYGNCLSHLEEQQKEDKNTKMVINMSFGSAGPLTVEKLWIEKVAERGDILFVGSAGNNGSWYRPTDSNRGGRADPGQYLSYPASYDIPEMISVANARCDNTIDLSSQKNKRVSIAAPGLAILSSVPQQNAAVRAYITTNIALHNQTEPKSTSGSSRGSRGSLPFALGGFSGTGAGLAAPGETRRGLGFLPNGYREPRPVQGTKLNSTGLLPLVPCNMSSDPYHMLEYTKMPTDEAKNWAHENQNQKQPKCEGVSGAVCLVQLPGIMDWYKETCLAMLQCLKGGGKGLVLWRNDQLMNSLYSPSSDSDYGQNDAPDEFLLGTQVDCGLNCACWHQLQNLLGCKSSAECAQKAPPAIVVSSQHAQALQNAMKGAAGGPVAGSSSHNKTLGMNSGSSILKVNVTNYEYPYRHYDGTSMSAPHVSGAAGLLWRLFPSCPAAVIADGLRESAQPLPDQTRPHDLAAGSGMLRVDLAYDWLLKNQDKKCPRV